MFRVMSIARAVKTRVRRLLFSATVRLEDIENIYFPPRCPDCNSVMDDYGDNNIACPKCSPIPEMYKSTDQELRSMYLDEYLEAEEWEKRHKAEYDAVVRRPAQGRSYTVDEACDELNVSIWSPQIEVDPRVEGGVFFCVKRLEDEIGTTLSEKHIAFVLGTGRIEVTTGGCEFLSYEDLNDATPRSILEYMLANPGECPTEEELDAEGVGQSGVDGLSKRYTEEFDSDKYEDDVPF